MSDSITCYLCEAPLFAPERFLVDDYGHNLSVCEGCYEAALDDQDEEIAQPVGTAKPESEEK